MSLDMYLSDFSEVQRELALRVTLGFASIGVIYMISLFLKIRTISSFVVDKPNKDQEETEETAENVQAEMSRMQDIISDLQQHGTIDRVSLRSNYLSGFAFTKGALMALEERRADARESDTTCCWLPFCCLPMQQLLCIRAPIFDLSHTLPIFEDDA